MTTKDGPRIPPVTAPDDEQAAALAKTIHRRGSPLRLFATLAHHPRLLRRFNALGGLFFTGALDPRERELVILRVAVRADSPYELAQHVELGREAGLTSTEIKRVIADLDEGWSTGDRLLLRMTDELLDDMTVSHETWSALQTRYGTDALLELLLLPGFYRMLAGLLDALKIEPEPDAAAPG